MFYLAQYSHAEPGVSTEYLRTCAFLTPALSTFSDLTTRTTGGSMRGAIVNHGLGI